VTIKIVLEGGDDVTLVVQDGVTCSFPCFLSGGSIVIEELSTEIVEPGGKRRSMTLIAKIAMDRHPAVIVVMFLEGVLHLGPRRVLQVRLYEYDYASTIMRVRVRATSGAVICIVRVPYYTQNWAATVTLLDEPPLADGSI
jgi:hypothetical protein